MQYVGSNTATITWTTNVPTYDYVVYGIKSNKLFTSYTDTSALRTQHAVKITGLKPSTKYFYQVKAPATGKYPAVSSSVLNFTTTK